MTACLQIYLLHRPKNLRDFPWNGSETWPAHQHPNAFRFLKVYSLVLHKPSMVLVTTCKSIRHHLNGDNRRQPTMTVCIHLNIIFPSCGKSDKEYWHSDHYRRIKEPLCSLCADQVCSKPEVFVLYCFLRCSFQNSQLDMSTCMFSLRLNKHFHAYLFVVQFKRHTV